MLYLTYPQPYGSGLSVDVKCKYWRPKTGRSTAISPGYVEHDSSRFVERLDQSSEGGHDPGVDHFDAIEVEPTHSDSAVDRLRGDGPPAPVGPNLAYGEFIRVRQPVPLLQGYIGTRVDRIGHVVVAVILFQRQFHFNNLRRGGSPGASFPGVEGFSPRGGRGGPEPKNALSIDLLQSATPT